MQKARVWLSYDLGVGGDYEGLYTFLDTLGAKECGDSLAFFEYEYESDLESELKKEIREKVSLNKDDRIYIIATYYTQEGKKKVRSKVFIWEKKETTLARLCKG